MQRDSCWTGSFASPVIRVTVRFCHHLNEGICKTPSRGVLPCVSDHETVQWLRVPNGTITIGRLRANGKEWWPWQLIEHPRNSIANGHPRAAWRVGSMDLSMWRRTEQHSAFGRNLRGCAKLSPLMPRAVVARGSNLPRRLRRVWPACRSCSKI